MTDAIADLLRQAADAVERAGIEEGLRPAAFAAAVELLRTDVSDLVPPANVRGPERGTSPNVGLLGAVAAKLDISTEHAEAVYEEDGGSLHLIIRRDTLPDSRRLAAAMRDVSLLVSAGRQAAGLEEWTSFKRLREECEELKVLDGTNFSTEIKRLPARFQGSRANQELKLTRHGYAEAKRLIERIAGGEGNS